MASPQVENGHTRIANELMEHLMRLHLAPNQWQVLLCIIRKTYGFHKKADYITNTQICQETGVRKPNVSRALKALQERNIISRDSKYIGLQKDWEQWQKLSVQATKVISSDNQPTDKKLSVQHQKLSVLQPKLSVQATKVINLAPTKEIYYTKDTIQKKEYPQKEKHGEFQNVLLSEQEMQKLKDRLGGEAERYIEKLSAYLASRGKRYKSHYATILNWWRRDKEAHAKNRNPREIPKPEEYTPTPDYPELRGIE